MFKKIPGFPYEISDKGEVLSLHERGRPKNGSKKPAVGLLKSFWRGSKKRPYLSVTLYPGGVQRFVHQLVLEAFKGPRPPGALACHWDDDTSNNSIENLHWGYPWTNKIDQVFNQNREHVRTLDDPLSKWEGLCIQSAKDQFPGMPDDHIWSVLRKGSLVLKLPPMPEDALEIVKRFAVCV
jgi:hypothetical protein